MFAQVGTGGQVGENTRHIAQQVELFRCKSAHRGCAQASFTVGMLARPSRDSYLLSISFRGALESITVGDNAITTLKLDMTEAIFPDTLTTAHACVVAAVISQCT